MWHLPLHCHTPWWMMVVLAVTGTECRIYESSIQVEFGATDAAASILMEKGYGFLEGGQVRFQATCPSHNTTTGTNNDPLIFLLFCSTAEGRQFARMEKRQLNFDCLSIADLKRTDAFCGREQIKGVNNHTTFLLRHKVTRNYFYKFLLLQCPTTSKTHQNNQVTDRKSSLVLTCHATLTLLNPDSEHLSSDEIPMPLIYYILMVLWILVSITWMGNYIIYNKFSNKLHKCLSVAPLVKSLLVIIILLNWRLVSDTGVEPNPDVSLHYLLQSLCDAYLFMLMIVIAEGYCILHTKLTHFKWTSLLLMFSIFASSLVCVYWVHSYFLAFSVCCVVFMMYKTLKWCSYNIEFLYRRRRKFHHFVHRCSLRCSGPVTLEQQLSCKLDMFTRFRVLCAAFSMVYAIVVTLATFLTEYTYIQALTYELPQLLIYSCIGVIFRLRNFSPYENIHVVVPKENCVAVMLPDVCAKELNPNIILGIPIPTPTLSSQPSASLSPADPSSTSSSTLRRQRARSRQQGRRPLLPGDRRGVFTRHLLMYTHQI